MDIKDFLIDEDDSMINAMKQLDKTEKKILFVVRDNQLVAALTDGDMRRWILKKGDLNAKVKEIANYNPKWLNYSDRNKANSYMKEHSIEALPILNSNNSIHSIKFLNDEAIVPKRQLNLPVVIMAGGLGTRLYPYTKILPKALIPIGEIPIIEHIINRFNKYGVRKFHIIVNHKKNMIKAYFNEIERDYEVSYVDEDKPLGTGGGLSLLKEKINSTFILSNCDIIIEEDFDKIYNYHKKEKNLITMICSLKNIQIPYGVIEINEDGEIENMKEKPEISFFTNTGVYIVEPKVVEVLEDGVSVGFPDVIEKHKQAGDKIGVFPIGENAWMDMGQIDEMEEMIRRLDKDE